MFIKFWRFQNSRYPPYIDFFTELQAPLWSAWSRLRGRSRRSPGLSPWQPPLAPISRRCLPARQRVSEDLGWQAFPAGEKGWSAPPRGWSGKEEGSGSRQPETRSFSADRTDTDGSQTVVFPFTFCAHPRTPRHGSHTRVVPRLVHSIRPQDEGSRRRRALGVYKRDNARRHARHLGLCRRGGGKIMRPRAQTGEMPRAPFR